MNLFFLKGLQAANTANKFADDPEFTITAYFDPMVLANFFSKFEVILDIVILFDKITLTPSAISFFEKASSNKEYLFILIFLIDFIL
jgi:hypothetical protein